MLFNSLVRSVLESSAIIQYPINYLIKIIEKIHNKFLRQIQDFGTMPSSQFRELYQIHSLSDRRDKIIVTFLFKVTNNLIDSHKY